MESFKIITDTTTDLPMSYIKENELGLVYLTYFIDGESYTGSKQLDPKDFYEKMRSGLMPTTSQANPEDAKLVFEKELETCKNLLCISFSSALSGTYNSCRMAAEEIMEERDDCKIIVIDSLCASLGEGLLVEKAVELKKAGKSMEEVVAWVEEHKKNLIHIFTVDDLFHLYKGGRVSKTTAVMGSMINIKPILHVDEEGCLTAVGKVRGRKKSLKALVDGMDERVGSYRDKNDTVFISHGDCIEDAEYVQDLVKEKFGIDSKIIHHIGPSIGAHAGPGTVALFFLGDVR